MVRLLVVALLAPTAGCSLVIDTSDAPRELRLESPTLYEGLGSFPSARPVPIAIAGAGIRADDEVTLAVDDQEPVVCDDTCFDQADALQLCCSLLAGADRAALAVRIPLIYSESNGELDLLVSVRRGDRLIGQGATTIEALPEATATEFGEEITVVGDGIVRYSQIGVPAGTSFQFDSNVPVRLRVTGNLAMEQGTTETQAGTIQVLEGGCSTCPPETPASLNPLLGAGPESDSSPGAGAMAVRVDGSFAGYASPDPSGNPIFLAYGDSGEQGGALVVSLLGGVSGGLVLNSDDDGVGVGKARVMAHPDLNANLIASPAFEFRGPALLVGTATRAFTELPVLTDESTHLVEVIADRPED
jgi:hypothetical protein